MKRVFALILTLVLVLSCAGCTPKTALTAADFQTAMEEAGFEVTDITDTYDTNGIEVVILKAEKDDCEIEFFEFKKVSDAQGVYANFRDEAEDLPHSGYASVSMSNFAKYEQTSGSAVYFMSIIDNTIVYYIVEKDDSSAAKDIVGALGYN
jgi:hypothetical protein